MLEAWETLDTKEKKENRHAHWNHPLDRFSPSDALRHLLPRCRVVDPRIVRLAGRGAKHAGTPGDDEAGKEHLTRHLDFAMTRAANGPAVRDYQVELTKKLHVIIVNDDLSVFLHVHPRLLQNGHFVLDQHFPAEGKYHIFADATPAGLEQQVFRFDVGIGAVSAGHTGALVPTGTLVTARR